MNKSILVVSDNKLFIEGIVDELKTQGFDYNLISNLTLINQTQIDITCLSDSFLLEEVLIKNEVVIYENMSSIPSGINNITSITNMVNGCINFPEKRLIYLGNQKGYNTSPFEITMNENDVNNFTKRILPPVRHSLLMDLEVMRGINEGCNAIIFSTPSMLFEDECLDQVVFQKVYEDKNAINYFVHKSTLFRLVLDAISSGITGKYLVHDIEMTYEKLLTKVKPSRKTILEKLVSLVWPSSKMNRLILNNDYSRQQLKFELKKI